MKKPEIIIVSLVILIFFISYIVWADEYHVSPTGNDTNLGTQENPWRTIQYAADSVAPGDTVYIHAGTYNESVTFSLSGTANAPITFSGAQDEDVIVRGDFTIIRGTSYINIENLTIRDFSIWGISLNGDNHHIILSDLAVIGGECGVHFTWGYSGQTPAEGPVSDVTLENSIIRDSIYTAVDGTPGPCNRMTFRNLEISGAGMVGQSSWGSDGIAVERGRDILVEGCYIHDNGGDGIDLNSRDFNGNVSGIAVRRNQVVRNRRNGVKLWAGGLMENNAVWGQGDTAVVIGAYRGTYRLINNSIAYNMWNADFSIRNYSLVAAYPETGTSSRMNLTMINNIFAFNTGPNVGAPTGIYLGAGVNLVNEGYNLFWSRADGEIFAGFLGGGRWFTRNEIANGTWASATGQGRGDIVGNPIFCQG